MGKAKELAELGDKLTVTGSAVTVSGFNYDNIVAVSYTHLTLPTKRIV